MTTDIVKIKSDPYRPENTKVPYDAKKAKRILAYKRKLKGNSQNDYASHSVSPNRVPVKAASTKIEPAQIISTRVCLGGVPASNYTRIDVRQGEMVFIQFQF